MPSEISKKKIVYIMGLGRSGTTLMDIVMGNGEHGFSCGELCRYPLRRGKRRNTPTDSPRLEFWESVLDQLAMRDKQFVNFKHLQKLHRRYEYHTGYLRDCLLGLRRSRELEQYHAFLRAFYGVLFKQSEAGILIDSSKYAGRAWHLSLALPTEQYEICYLYIIRNPINVTRSFKKKDIEQSSKNCLSANLVYFVVNTICHKCCNKLTRKHRVARVNFERFLSDPATCSRDLEKVLGVELSQLSERLEKGRALTVGNLFDGNRIRHQEKIKLQRSNPPINLSHCDRFSWLINRRVYEA